MFIMIIIKIYEQKTLESMCGHCKYRQRKWEQIDKLAERVTSGKVKAATVTKGEVSQYSTF